MNHFIRLILSVLITGCLLITSLSAQKTVSAYRIDSPITVDGEFGDWASDVPLCNDFIQLEPNPGEPSSFETEVYIAYDDKALYVKAILTDTVELVRRDLTARDQTGNGDWFGILIDPYRNGLSAVTMNVTAGGVQIDEVWDGDSTDSNWDAVWDSKVVHTDTGWNVEMEIPYAALRFGDDDVQDWYINFARYTRRNRQMSFWSPVDPGESGITRQSGIMENIKEIKSPLRLSLTPFVVGTHTNSQGNTNNSFGAGLDLKYGLTEAFTLDMTLIPDFSSVQSDDVVVNLGPFEQFFEERRQFFTEGTDIFERGGIFFSRRIGGNLFSFGNVDANGTVTSSVPTRAQLLNATKISGKFQNGSGLGFFNAIEAREEVTVDLDGEINLATVHPLTNYNVVVYDHVLKNNSYISLINTNVMRQGSALDANVTGTEYQLRTKDQKWQLSGDAALSQRFSQGENSVGHKFNASISDIQGSWQQDLNYTEESDTYNPNDLGFLFSNNERSINYNVAFNQFEQTARFNRYRFWASVGANALYQPNVYTGAFAETGGFWFTRKFFAFGYSSGIFHNARNYFEPRTSDFSQFWDQPNGAYFSPFISTDFSKTFAIDVSINRQHYFNNSRRNTSFTVEPRVQINSQWLIIFESNYNIIRGREGFVNKSNFAFDQHGLVDEDILFGLRNRDILTNTFTTNYVFTNRMSMDLRIRHYWDRIDYDEYYTLGGDGDLSLIGFDGNDENGDPVFKSNINLFNIDLNYYWRYAPGSDIIFSYKNNAFNDQFIDGYTDNLNSLFEGRSNHTFSLKVLYFLDVNQAAQALRGRSI